MTAQKQSKEVQIINAVGKNYLKIIAIIIITGLVFSGIVFSLLFSVQKTGTEIKTNTVKIEPVNAKDHRGKQ